MRRKLTMPLLLILFFALSLFTISLQPTHAGNCDGLPITGGDLPTGTYTLTDDCVATGTLNVGTGVDVTINGGGFAIDGNNTHLVLSVGFEGALTLNNVTIRNGNSDGDGGGIRNLGGGVTLTNSRVSGNSGRGIYNWHHVGAARLTLINSTVSGNSDGGIFNDGGATVINSTISGNTSGGAGGGIYNISRLTVINSTISGNSGAFAGGIYDSEEATLTNTIVSANTMGNCGGPSIMIDGGGNLVDTANGGGCLGITPHVDADPLLGAFNGSYYPLLEGSPAIDSAPTCAGLTGDQIGTPRPQGLACDIGAIEVINTSVPNCDGLPVTEGDIPSGTYTLTSNCFIRGILNVPAGVDVTINGGGFALDAIDAFDDVIRVADGGTLTLDNLVIRNAIDNGIENLGTVTVTNSTFSGNGWGISNSETGTVTVANSTVSDNYSGISNRETGTLTVTNSTVSDNSSGIWNNGTGIVTVANSTFFDNTWGIGNSGTGTMTVTNSTVSENESGIVNSETGTMTVTNTIVSANTTGNCGGTNALTDGGGNLIDTANGGGCDGITPHVDADPMLGAFNGSYYPLLEGSPAIDGAPTCAGLTDDQIGTARPQGLACDIGAIEAINTPVGNCAGLPVTEGDLPTGIYTLTDDCVTTWTLNVPNGADVTINGNGFAIDGNNTHQVLSVVENGILTLSNVTIRNGNSGDGVGSVGGIYNRGGTVTLTNSMVSGNFGEGIHSLHTNKAAWVTLINSTVSGNSEGGINNAGILRITNSTISGNFGRGGIYNIAQGSLTLINSTVSGNTAAGENRGGITNSARATLQNTIISGNTGGGNCVFGSFTDGGGNLIDTANGGGCLGITPHVDADPMLGAFNGSYYPLLAGSPAIDGAPTCAGMTNDQIGTARPQGLACDIGAIEVINTSVANCGGLPITEGDLPAGTYTMTDDCVTTGTLNVGTDIDVTINGNGFAIDGNNTHQVLNVGLRGRLTLNNITIRNGNSDGAGGGIYNRGGTVTLTNSMVSDNSGGGIYGWDHIGLARVTLINSTVSGNSEGGITSDGSLTLINSTVSGNSDTHGGGIYNFRSLTLINSTVSDNSATISGGGIYTTGDVTLTNTIISNNSGGNCVVFGPAITDGGGNLIDTADGGGCLGITPHVDADPMLGAFNGSYYPLLEGSPAIDSAPTCAGITNDQIGTPRPQGIACDIGAIEVINTSVANCEGLPVTEGDLPSGTYTLTSNCFIRGLLNVPAGVDVTINGGGFAIDAFDAFDDIIHVMDGGTLTLDNGIIRNAIYNGIENEGTLTVTNSTFSDNNGNGFGRGIENVGTGILTVTNSTFSDNNWGIENQGTLTVTNSTFSHNGSGVVNSDMGTVTVTNSTFSDNGWGISNSETGTVTVTNSTVSENSRGIRNSETGTMTVTNTIVSANTTGNCGGTNALTDGGGNLIHTANGGGCDGITPHVDADPMLGAFNGSYYPLLEGSPAINGAPTCAGLTDDQIGTSRPQGLACDIGAIEVIDETAVPVKPDGLSISGDLNNAPVQPTYTWNHDLQTTWYYVQLNRGATMIFQTWFEVGTDVICDATCSITPSTTLTNGGYTWWVQGYNSNGTGVWSDGDTFNVNVPAPAQPSNLTTSGSLTTPPVQPTYEWTHDPNTTWYELYVSSPTGVVIDTWYEVGVDITCNGTCTITPNTTLSNGNHSWWVNAYNSVGSVWSDVANFIVAMPAPAQPSNLNTSGSLTTPPVQPTYEWTHDPNTTWYELYVSNASGIVIDTWYEVGVDITCSDTCAITPNTALSNGNHNWWVNAYNSVGSVWSDVANFTVAMPAPAQPSNLNTSGSLTTPPVQPTYEWTHDPNTTWYELYVSDASGIVIDTWYEVGVDITCGGTCTIMPDTALPNGNYSWWVNAYNSIGSIWSDVANFTVAVPD